MKLAAAELPHHLSQHGVQPCYLVHGEDAYLIQQTCQQITKAATEHGITAQPTLTLESASDWAQLEAELYNNSLFAKRKLLRVRLPKVKPLNQGAQLMIDYANQPNPNCCLLIITPKLTTKDLQAKWIKQLDKLGMIINISALKPYQFAKWLETELNHNKLRLIADGINSLTQLVANNLGNATSAIQKLALLNSDQPIDAKLVVEMVADSNQASLYTLVDQTLAAKYSQLTQTLARLNAQNCEPLLILWALSGQLRILYQMAYAKAKGDSMQNVLNANRVWSTRKALFLQVVNAHSFQHWQQCIIEAQRLDVVIKTNQSSRIWDELLQLCLRITGQPFCQLNQ